MSAAVAVAVVAVERERMIIGDGGIWRTHTLARLGPLT